VRQAVLRTNLTVVALVFFGEASFAQSILPDPKLHALVVQGIDLTWSGKYRSADSLFQEVIREFPDHPAGYIYKAGVMQSAAIDHEIPVDRAAFDSILSLGNLKAQALSKINSAARWGDFFLGTAYGFESYARVYRGDWMTGAMRGIASVSAFKKAIELDSSMGDAYAGIGAFYYWRSRKTENFNWLPFVGDDRPEAFAFLKRTIDSGVYNRQTALSMLGSIYADAGQYEKAVGCFVEGHARYPMNQTYLWGLATSLQKLGKSHEALDAYRDLLRSIVGDQENNHYNEIVCLLDMSKVCLSIADSAGANTHLNTLLRFRDIPFPVSLQTRAHDKFDEADRLLRKLKGQ
jgi:tetratricopeptide (TPR) repeat protein